MTEANRLDALRVYLSQADQAKRNKNLNILRKRGELNINDQIYRNTNPLMVQSDLEGVAPSYLKYELSVKFIIEIQEI